ncbi:Ku protein [Mesorhizobium soli]|uniref:Ku protein n=1 Tax=Pseudaminobacter soli (ex Li et al. 2025) TaxID=1295366 RepID=UPI0024732F1D|nr:Ku protein [Mesorhizobium soli]MDH6231951.1 Ku protein [Mesorhizobium soli]
MSSVRSLWKGFMRLGNVTCGVKIVGAWTDAETVHIRILNRETKEPVKPAYIDEGTGKEVETKDQVKGYEIDKNEYLLLAPSDLDTLKPLSNHVLTIENFVDLSDVGQVYRDKPYYLAPADKPSTDPSADECQTRVSVARGRPSRRPASLRDAGPLLLSHKESPPPLPDDGLAADG